MSYTRVASSPVTALRRQIPKEQRKAEIDVKKPKQTIEGGLQAGGDYTHVFWPTELFIKIHFRDAPIF